MEWHSANTLAACLFLGLLAAQTALSIFFSRTDPFKHAPTYMAHQVITMPLMACIGSLGLLSCCRTWGVPLTPEDRLFGEQPDADLIARLMLAIQAWDILLHISVEWLRQPEMIVHHLLTALISFLGANRRLLLHYAPFFLGVVELSSVPLVVVSTLHPERFGWLVMGKESSIIVAKVNSICRYSFAASFIVLRLLCWPVVGLWCWSDMLWALYSDAESAVANRTCIGLLFLASPPLLCLQFKWGHVVMLQVQKQFMLLLRPDKAILP